MRGKQDIRPGASCIDHKHGDPRCIEISVLKVFRSTLDIVEGHQDSAKILPVNKLNKRINTYIFTVFSDKISLYLLYSFPFFKNTLINT